MLYLCLTSCSTWSALCWFAALCGVIAYPLRRALDHWSCDAVAVSGSTHIDITEMYQPRHHFRAQTHHTRNWWTSGVNVWKAKRVTFKAPSWRPVINTDLHFERHLLDAVWHKLTPDIVQNSVLLRPAGRWNEMKCYPFVFPYKSTLSGSLHLKVGVTHTYDGGRSLQTTQGGAAGYNFFWLCF